MKAKFRRRHLALTLNQDLLNGEEHEERAAPLSDALTQFGRALGLLSAPQAPESPEISPTASKRPFTPPSATISTHEEDITDAEAALRQRSIEDRSFKLLRQQDQRMDDQMALRMRRAEQPAPKQRKAVCKYYMEGTCSKGDECTFRHAGKPKKTSLQEVCKFFRAGKCLKGPLCPFSHDLKRVPCKFHHLWGGCSAGDECKYSHGHFSKEELDKFFAENDK